MLRENRFESVSQKFGNDLVYKITKRYWPEVLKGYRLRALWNKGDKCGIQILKHIALLTRFLHHRKDVIPTNVKEVDKKFHCPAMRAWTLLLGQLS